MTIQASPERVFQAITERKGLAAWWTRDVEAEPEVGSVARFGFGGRKVVFRMKIVNLEPGGRVEWSCLGDPPPWKDNRITFELTKDGDKTAVLFNHTGLGLEGSAYGNINYSWARYLASLASYLETGQGAPSD